MAYVFSGGIFFKNDDTTQSFEIKRPPKPDEVFLPLTGSAAAAAAGTRVEVGQTVAVSGDRVPMLHSPVSGVVEGIAEIGGARCVVIKNDMQDSLFHGLCKMNKKLADCTSEEIIEKIRTSGIVCPEDGRPAADKLADAVGKADRCIINCAESEPYISCDLAVTSSSPSAVVNGLKIFMRALGIRHGVIAVPEGYQSVAKRLTSVIGGSSLITVETVSAKYPQGNERRLVYAVTGREPRPHCDMTSLGCVVFNVQTCVAVYGAFVSGMPLISRTVSVGGDCVNEYVNVEVPIGTKFSALAEYAGGLKGTPALVVEGGPLSGVRASVDGVVSKTTKAVLFFSEKSVAAESKSPVCIRCGRCVSACPERLMPNRIYAYLRDGKAKEAVKIGALDCMGCGICSYVCPGKAPVTELIAKFREGFGKKRGKADADGREDA